MILTNWSSGVAGFARRHVHIGFGVIAGIVTITAVAPATPFNAVHARPGVHAPKTTAVYAPNIQPGAHAPAVQPERIIV